MTLSEFITNVNDAIRGIDDEVPLIGSEEWNYWTRLLNRKKNELYEDVTKSWSNTYAVANVGTINAATDPFFNLGGTFLSPANKAYVITTDNRRIDFTIIEPQEADPRYQQVFVAGQDPQVLHFTKEILADDEIVGGTLYLPGYFMPANVSQANGSAVIPLPDPYWGVLAVATEIAFGDVTYEDKSTDLNNKANALYAMMTKKNRRGTYGNPRVTPTRVNPIRGPEGATRR